MSEQIMRENLFVLAQAYADARGLSMTTVSKRIHGNQRFLEKYLAGEISTTIRIYYQMIRRLRDGWPKGAPWPKTRGVPRPTRVDYETQSRSNERKRGGDGKFVSKKKAIERSAAP
jgi:hypothetical protein